MQFSDAGMADGSAVQITLPRYYEGTDQQVYVQISDRFYIKDLAVLVPNTQKVTASLTGVDSLTYKAVCGQFCQDAHGKEYLQNSDYSIVDGKVKWLGPNRPGFNAEVNKGTVYSIRYLYTPYFYVSKLIHEIRIANQIDFLTGQRVPSRAPYAALLHREYVMHKKENEGGEQDNRTIPPPDVFGDV
jgi:hypothetical protein